MLLDARLKADIPEKAVNDGAPEFAVVRHVGQEVIGARLGAEELFKRDLIVVKHEPFVQGFRGNNVGQRSTMASAKRSMWPS